VKIRKAGLPDVDLLMDLRTKFNDFHRALDGKKPGKGWKKEYRKELIKELGSKNILKLIAHEGNRPAGTVFCGLVKNQPGTNNWLESKKTGLIKFLYVCEDFRGRGIATSLIKECFIWMKKHGALAAELVVADNNHNAHGLYKEMGFKDRSVRMTRKV